MNDNLKKTPLNCPCSGQYLTRAFSYDAPPKGETRFTLAADESYYREIWQCQICNHFISLSDMDLSDLYRENYVSSTYGEKGVEATFQRIISLPPEQSDNIGRVKRVCQFAETHFASVSRPLSILDVGSGLCVFLHLMKAGGWDCTALDPDPRSVKHAREVVGVKAICGDFLAHENLGQFDAIAFNKVLEHVSDPVAMLAESAQPLKKGGFVYIELPDGEIAAQAEGFGREEFFIDHLHIFSLASLALLAQRAGFQICSLERLQEPSSKYTLRGFLLPKF